MTAAAAAQPATPPTLLQGIAQNLGVPSAKLESAIRAAELERWNAFASAHHIPEKRSKAVSDRIRTAPVTLRAQFGDRSRHGLLGAAAGYLGLSRDQLVQELRQGKSLAEVATAHGKTADGLKAALLTAAGKDLEERVAAGDMTAETRDRLLTNLKDHIAEILQGRFRSGTGASGVQARPLRAG